MPNVFVTNPNASFVSLILGNANGEMRSIQEIPSSAMKATAWYIRRDQVFQCLRNTAMDPPFSVESWHIMHFRDVGPGV